MLAKAASFQMQDGSVADGELVIQEDTCARWSTCSTAGCSENHPLEALVTLPGDTWRIPRGQTPFTPESPAGQEPMTELSFVA